MSNKTIHELDSLSEIAQNDEMLIYDISAGADNPTKKTTVGTIKDFMANNIKDVYSTDEVKTNKVWIDGKPIYRLVWTASNINIGVNSDVALTNILANKNMNSLISIKGTVYHPHNAFINMIPNESIGVRFNTSDNYIYIRNNYSSNSNDCEVVLIIEYTKTTD